MLVGPPGNCPAYPCIKMAQNYRSINLSMLFFSRDHFSRCGSLNRNMRREVKLVLNGSVLKYTIMTGHVFTNLWSILLYNIKAKNKIKCVSANPTNPNFLCLP